MPQITIQPLNVLAEANWDFNRGAPSWSHHRYTVSSTFDPFPAYPHDLDAIAAAVDVVVGVCPPSWEIGMIAADREPAGRTNGFANVHDSGHYEGDGPLQSWVKDPPLGVIMLCGKRIPPHPAMTRYLVAHEYGHHIEWMLNYAARTRYLHDLDTIEDYMRRRGLPEDTNVHGTGGRWHTAATEIFACDFRIMACGVETEFWPHPGVPRPESVPGLGGWWREALARITASQAATGQCARDAQPDPVLLPNQQPAA